MAVSLLNSALESKQIYGDNQEKTTLANSNLAMAEKSMSQNGSEAVSTGTERRARLQHTIQSLVELRQKVVVSFCELSGVSSFDARDLENHNLDPTKLRRFCQIMVDYTAMGHFEVYQRIIEGKERRNAVKQVADEVYPAIAETTDFLIDFNDKYDAFDATPEEVELLNGDLAKLGQILSIRGELEDQILAALAK